MERQDELAVLARRLRALPASCGPVRLVAVDGHAGSGKSTLAGRLAVALGGAPVVHLDDVASHGALFDWVDRLTAQVTGPLSRGEPARFEVYDWDRRVFTGGGRADPAEVVLLEGVGAGRRALRPLLACLLWLDLPESAAWTRGRHRDGEELSDFWEGWTRAERSHFQEDPSHSFAHWLVRELATDYEVLPGPAVPSGSLDDITVGEGAAARDKPPGGRSQGGLDRGSAQELRFR